MRAIARAGLSLGIIILAATPVKAADSDLQIVSGVPLPGLTAKEPETILLFDNAGRWLYIGASDAVMVLADGQKPVATLPAPEPQTLVLADPLRKGFIGVAKDVIVFDPGSKMETAHIPIPLAHLDAMVFEPRNTRLFLFGQNGMLVIDGATNAIVGTVPLPFEVRQAVADGTGRIFVSAAETDGNDTEVTKDYVAVIDAKRLEVKDKWPAGDLCRKPGALALDSIHRHLFVACRDRIDVLDSDFGAIETGLDAPYHVTGMQFDPALNRVFARYSPKEKAEGGTDYGILTLGPRQDGSYGILNKTQVLQDGTMLALDARDHRLFTMDFSAPENAILITLIRPQESSP